MAITAGGVIRDVVAVNTNPLFGYHCVYSVELLLLLATIWTMFSLIKSATNRSQFKEVSVLKEVP